MSGCTDFIENKYNISNSLLFFSLLFSSLLLFLFFFIRYQCPPTLRLHPPGKCPTIGVHCDADYKRHENTEINYWIPMTKVWESNTLWCESFPKRNDYTPVEMEPGLYVLKNDLFLVSTMKYFYNILMFNLT